MKMFTYLLAYLYLGWLKVYNILFCMAIATVIVLIGARLYLGPGKIIYKDEIKTEQQQMLEEVARPGVNGGGS